MLGCSAWSVFPSAPAPSPAREPAPAAGASDAEVRQCVMAGDHACVIRLLEGRARTETQLASFIEA